MINALKELKDVWGFEQEELTHIRQLMEEIASEAYAIGYADRKVEELEERHFYEGFSAYGDKEDWE